MEKRVYEEEVDNEGLANTTTQLTQALMESLPYLSEDRLVNLLEFVAVQHSGNMFNSDNSGKAAGIAAFLSRAPYATTPEGVSSLARLARHALQKSGGDSSTTEHRLWLITSGALNTAAAICEYSEIGDAADFFKALETNTVERNTYFHRDFAKRAMKVFVESAEALEGEEGGMLSPANERKQARQAVIDTYFGGDKLLFSAAIGAIFAVIVMVVGTAGIKVGFGTYQSYVYG